MYFCYEIHSKMHIHRERGEGERKRGKRRAREPMYPKYMQIKLDTHTDIPDTLQTHSEIHIYKHGGKRKLVYLRYM